MLLFAHIHVRFLIKEKIVSSPRLEEQLRSAHVTPLARRSPRTPKSAHSAGYLFTNASVIKRRTSTNKGGPDVGSKTTPKSVSSIIPVRHNYSAKHVIAALTSADASGDEQTDDVSSDDDLGVQPLEKPQRRGAQEAIAKGNITA